MMAAAAITTNPPSLQPDSLSHVDIATLSQAEILALSLCSSSAFDLRRTDDLVVPKIDRSFFNESAGSRRQTFSRPQSSPSSAATGHHRRRVAGLLPSPKPPLPFPSADAERNENRAIIDHLKQLISQDPKFDNVEFAPPSISAEFGQDPEILVFPIERKRKRGRKPKVKGLNFEAEGYGGLETLNRNGVAVDVSALASKDDPYAEELRRRTAGLESEEALLGFMRELEGQWGSRRKRRRIVDAAEFGDALPVGWKLLLGLKRKEGRAWVYCRRYISPTGEHFISCKDVSLYLQSIGCLSAVERLNGHRGDRLITETDAGLIFKDGDQRQDINPSSNVLTPISSEQGKEIVLLGMENLAEVQIHDLFECHKCNMTFDEKDSYLQHLLSFHQRTTRRYRLGSSVGDGVIIKDGKYECQFCHKVFLERRRYNGHVGIHVRNYVRRAEELPESTVHNKVESPTRDHFPSKISKMDALIEIAQSSILETSVGPDDRSKGGCAPDKYDAISSPEGPVSNSDNEPTKSPLSEQEVDDNMIDQDNLNQQDNSLMVTDGSMEKPLGTSEIVDVKLDSILDNTTYLSTEVQRANSPKMCLKEDGLAFSIDATEQDTVSKSDRSTPLSAHVVCDIVSNAEMNDGGNLEKSRPVEVDNNENRVVEASNSENNKLIFDTDGSIHAQAYDVVKESVRQTFEGIERHRETSDSSMLQLPHFPSSNAIPDKEERLFPIEPRHGNVTGFEELRLEEIEPLKYSFVDGQESDSLQDVPIELANNAGMEGAFGSSVQFESEEVMLDLATGHQLCMVCVWCGIVFNHGAVDSEIQSDSVGFMCPTCKARISGQVNVLDNGSPVNPHPL